MQIQQAIMHDTGISNSSFSDGGRSHSIDLLAYWKNFDRMKLNQVDGKTAGKEKDKVVANLDR